MGAAPNASANVLASARRMNSNSTNGPMKASYSMAVTDYAASTTQACA